MTNAQSEAAKSRLRKSGMKTTLSASNREILDWSRKHRQYIEDRNNALTFIFMFAVAIGASVAINYQGLPSVTTFLNGTFFEIGALASIAAVEFGIWKQMNESDTGLMIMNGAMAAAGFTAVITTIPIVGTVTAGIQGVWLVGMTVGCVGTILMLVITSVKWSS